MEQSPFPLAHMESPWVGELQPPTPATLDMDLLDKQPGLVWSLMEEPQEHGVEVNQPVKVSECIAKLLLVVAALTQNIRGATNHKSS